MFTKMEECSCRLGVPMNCIFPVKNYHNEHTTDKATDILILDALLNIVNFARDYVEDKLDDEKSSRCRNKISRQLEVNYE